MSVLEQRWRDISIDFVTGILEVNKDNVICVVVYRLTKQRYYITTTVDINAPNLARLFVHYVWKLHGLPETITSDRGT